MVHHNNIIIHSFRPVIECRIVRIVSACIFPLPSIESIELPLPDLFVNIMIILFAFAFCNRHDFSLTLAMKVLIKAFQVHFL